MIDWKIKTSLQENIQLHSDSIKCLFETYHSSYSSEPHVISQGTPDSKLSLLSREDRIQGDAYISPSQWCSSGTAKEALAPSATPWRGVKECILEA